MTIRCKACRQDLEPEVMANLGGALRYPEHNQPTRRYAEVAGVYPDGQVATRTRAETRRCRNAMAPVKAIDMITVRDHLYVYRGVPLRFDAKDPVGDAARVRFHARCERCEASWSCDIERAILRQIYKVIPTSPSPSVLIEKLDGPRRLVDHIADTHMCMPLGYVPIPPAILARVDSSATAAEQLDALATELADLAGAAMRGDF